jgi:phosphoribosylglycinamide formyltransferase-1
LLFNFAVQSKVILSTYAKIYRKYYHFLHKMHLTEQNKNACMPHRIALFASGSGSNAENIVNYFSGSSDVQTPLIVSNKPDAYVHERARKLGVPSYTFTASEFREATAILKLLEAFEIDFIVLAGFLLKVSEPILHAYPNKIINIHPALLPKFGGKGMYGHHVHEAVVAAGERETGITIHYVNENYDEGAIIFQARCPVTPDDTPDNVAQKIHELEQEHFPAQLQKIFNQ